MTDRKKLDQKLKRIKINLSECKNLINPELKELIQRIINLVEVTQTIVKKHEEEARH